MEIDMDDSEKTTIQTALDYAVARLREPSTWAGIALFLGFFGVSSDTVARITSNGPALIVAVATLIAIFAPSRSSHAAHAASRAATVADMALEAAQKALDKSQSASSAQPEDLPALNSRGK